MKAHNGFRFAATLLALFVIAGISFAQQGYKKPPKEVLDILNAPVTPGISVSPRNRCCDSPAVALIPRSTHHTVISIQSR